MPKAKLTLKTIKPKKTKLPEGTLEDKHWNVQPEKLAAYYTAVSQRYFQETLLEHFPSAAEYFEVVVKMMEIESTDNGYTGWKALAHQWVEFLNALTFHNHKNFYYHSEANTFISELEPSEFPIYHRTLSICSSMMDHMSFAEALKMWKDLRNEIPDTMKVFEFADHHYEWSTPVKLMDINSGRLLATIDDSRWIKLNPTKQVNPFQTPLISYGGGDKPN